MKDIRASLGAHKMILSPFHPPGKATSERFNSTLEHMLSTCVKEDQCDGHISGYHSFRHRVHTFLRDVSERVYDAGTHISREAAERL